MEGPWRWLRWPSCSTPSRPGSVATSPSPQTVCTVPDVTVAYTVDGDPRTKAVVLTDLANTIDLTVSVCYFPK